MATQVCGRARGARVALALAALVVVLPGCASGARSTVVSHGTQEPQARPTATATPVPLARRIFVATFGFGVSLVSVDGVTGRVLWTSALPPEGGHEPVVAGGLVYIVTSEQVGTPTAVPPVFQDEVVALDTMSGAVRWRYSVPNTSVTLVVGGTVVYVIFSNGPLVALDASTGQELWHTTVGLSPSAVADGNALYLLSDTLRAYGATTGAPLWRAPLPAVPPQGYAGPVYDNLALAPGMLFATFPCGGVDVQGFTFTKACLGDLDTRTGALRWSTTLATLAPSCLFMTGTSCATNPGGIFCYLVGSCSSTPSGVVLAGSAVAALYTNYALSGAQPNDALIVDMRLAAFDPSSGHGAWSVVLPNSQVKVASGSPHPQPSNPETYTLEGADGTAVYVESSTNQLIAYRDSDHTRLWQDKLTASSTYFFEQDGVLYSLNGRTIVALDAATGSQLWRTSV